MREGVIEVRDGRKVAYGEFGDPSGTPVLMCHGSAECRLFEVDPEWTTEQGVRVITADRPGFGGSDPQPDRTVVGWACDAEDLADALGIDTLVADFAAPWVEDPDTFGLGGEMPEEDLAVEAHPTWGPNLRAQIREGLGRADGVAWDAAALYGSWGFTVDEVSQPADVWHGTVDSVTPFPNGDWLARTLPNATLHAVVGGHFIVYSHWREIVSTLLGRLP